MSMLRQVIRYAQFQWRAKGIYRIHSPFVFALYHRVLKGRGMQAFPDELKFYHHGFLKQRDHLERSEYASQERRKTVASIARNELVRTRDARMLFFLTKFLKPKVILELGTCLGRSTAAMAMGAPKSRFITIDQDAAVQNLAKEKIRELGIDNVEFEPGKFREILPKVLGQVKRVDIVFIDGDHEREETLYLVQMLLPYLSRHGALLIHDIHHNKGMMEAWSLAQGFPEVTVSLSTFSTGILFVDEGLSRERFLLRG